MEINARRRRRLDLPPAWPPCNRNTPGGEGWSTARRYSDPLAPRRRYAGADRLSGARHHSQREPCVDVVCLPSFQDSWSNLDTLNIAAFKTQPVSFPPLKRRPFMGLACQQCFGRLQRYALEDYRITMLGMTNILVVPTVNKCNSVLIRFFSDIAYTLQRDSGSHQYVNVVDAVLTSDRVRLGVQNEARRDGIEDLPAGDQLLPVFTKEAVRILERMRARISTAVIRLAGWVLLKSLRRLLNAVQVHRGQMMLIKKAAADGCPVIFLPNHRSHMDYILLTFILWHWDLRAPHVAAGDNLRIPVFTWLLRKLGGFFIRRRLDLVEGRKDFVYRAVLHSYMAELLKHGESIEFFVEGGRSRTGRTLTPKAGLLSVVVETYAAGAIDNAHIVPVSVSYEKLLEGSFSCELMGEPKQPESFWQAMKSMWHLLRANYGSVRVDFGQPVLLRDYLEAFRGKAGQGLDTSISSRTSSFASSTVSPPQVVSRDSWGSALNVAGGQQQDESRQMVSAICRHVAFDMENNKAIMCTNLLAFLLLTKYRKGVRMSDAIADFDFMVEELRCRHRDVGFCGNTADIVLYATRLLGSGLVTVDCSDQDSGVDMDATCADAFSTNLRTVWLRPALVEPSTALHMAYYGNAVVSAFLLDSVLATCVCVCMGKPLACWNQRDVISQGDLLERAVALCQIFFFEFLYCRPCTALEDALLDVLNRFVIHGYLRVPAQRDSGFVSNDERAWAARVANQLAWDDKSDQSGSETQDDEHCSSAVFEDQLLECDISSHSLAMISFFVSVLRPLVETYAVTVKSLALLYEVDYMLENEFVMIVQRQAVQNVAEGLHCCAESANVEAIRNALRWLVSLGILGMDVPTRHLYLQVAYKNDTAIVPELVSSLDEFLVL